MIKEKLNCLYVETQNLASLQNQIQVIPIDINQLYIIVFIHIFYIFTG